MNINLKSLVTFQIKTQIKIVPIEFSIQEWDEWDGFGGYKYKHHYMPNNITQRDVQRRRILKNHAEQRLRVNCIRKADILPAGTALNRKIVAFIVALSFF